VSKDPTQEDDGPALYVYTQDDPVNGADNLGLSKIEFEVLVGSLLVGISEAAGTWGQPWWTADGDYDIQANSAWSMVTVESRDAAGGSCNTVAPLVGDHGEGGRIQVYLSSDCPGEYKVKMHVHMDAFGSGKIGGADVLYTDIGGNTVSGRGTTLGPYLAERDLQLTVAVPIANKRVKIATYAPTIRFMHRTDKNSGTAYGLLEASEE